MQGLVLVVGLAIGFGTVIVLTDIRPEVYLLCSVQFVNLLSVREAEDPPR